MSHFYQVESDLFVQLPPCTQAAALRPVRSMPASASCRHDIPLLLVLIIYDEVNIWNIKTRNEQMIQKKWEKRERALKCLPPYRRLTCSHRPHTSTFRRSKLLRVVKKAPFSLLLQLVHLTAAVRSSEKLSTFSKLLPLVALRCVCSEMWKQVLWDLHDKASSSPVEQAMWANLNFNGKTLIIVWQSARGILK